MIQKRTAFLYHLFVALFLLGCALCIQHIPFIIRIILLFIAIIHLYDCWWFYAYDKDANI